MVKIKQELVNAIVNYLVTKPYSEVFQFINMLGESVRESGLEVPKTEDEGQQKERSDA